MYFRSTSFSRACGALLTVAVCGLLVPCLATAAGRPVNTVPPTVSGPAVVGSTLTSTAGTWSNAPTSYGFAWQRCNTTGLSCRLIAGATQPEYKVTSADVGATLRARVRAINASGSAVRRSDPTAVVRSASATPPSNTSRPTVSGVVQPGQRLSTTNGAWSGSPTEYAYSWRRCDSTGNACSAIALATQSTYTVADADNGSTIRSQVTASNAGGSSTSTSDQTEVVHPASPPMPVVGLHVSGNKLLDASGGVVQLHGVNYSGPEYACIQGFGIFDGPSDDASVAAIRSWNANVVRIPLNEDCWLGINGVNPAYGGANYRQAIVEYVGRLHQHGMAAELSLIWGAPGSNKADYQPGAPDADHSPDMWSSLAAAFKGDDNVLLAPWGETIVNANCFLNGGVCEATYGASNTPYNTAGMQQAVDVMRAAGYQGPIAIPGIDYANDMTKWLSHKPNDPLGQLVAEAHVYGKNTCSSVSCLDSTMAPVAAQVPLIFGETGETYDASSCGSSNITSLMNWADAHGVGYQAWTWDTWGTCGSLISDFNGTPANAYGGAVKAHLATRP